MATLVIGPPWESASFTEADRSALSVCVLEYCWTRAMALAAPELLVMLKSAGPPAPVACSVTTYEHPRCSLWP